MKPTSLPQVSRLDRRAFLAKALAAAGTSAAALNLRTAERPDASANGADYLKEISENERKTRSKDSQPVIGVGDKLKLTKVETFLVKPRWLFLKLHTNAGITGLG